MPALWLLLPPPRPPNAPSSVGICTGGGLAGAWICVAPLSERVGGGFLGEGLAPRPLWRLGPRAMLGADECPRAALKSASCSSLLSECTEKESSSSDE